MTVVLICEYSEEGAFGLVVNRPLDIPVSEALKDNPNASNNENKIFCGGPVQKSHMLYLHNDSLTEKSNKICEGVYLGGDINFLNSLLINNEEQNVSYRLYAGNSGWGAGQLDDEMKLNSWIICPASENFVFHPEPNKIWRQVLRSMGGQYALLSTYPSDPILN